MLPKDLKDMLEGIHFFLTDALKDEELSGKVECMRGGLILQLDALRHVYPTLHFSSASNPLVNATNLAPPPYTEQPNNGVVGSSRLSTCSGSTSNYSTGYSNSSSTGYSEEVSLQETREEVEESNSEEEEIYEDFDGLDQCRASPESKPKSKENQKLTRSDSRSSQSKLEENYLEDVEPVSFSVLISKCDYHGAVTKRSKSFLRNSRFQAVLSNHLLYLFQKESDDQQKKVIDLCGYSVRDCSIEDSRSSKKKGFAFELFGQGKKTHMFHCASERERNEWNEALNQSLPSLRSQTQVLKNPPRLTPSRVPPLPPPLLALTRVDEYSNATSQPDEEIYEELNSESDTQESDQVASFNKMSDYVVPNDEATRSVPVPLPVRQEVRIIRTVPERPPLPEILKKQSRPLPEAPDESYDQPEDDFSIYCEIDEDSFESLDPVENNANSITESINSPLVSSRSLSQEIFDTINEKVPNLPDRPGVLPQNDIEEFEDINYDIPLESIPVFKPKAKVPKPNEPPPIPAKGTPIATEEDDSLYKIPSSIIPQSIYQVPSSFPVCTEAHTSPTNNGGDNSNSTGSSSTGSKETARLPTNTQPEENQEQDKKVEIGTIPTSNSVKDLVAMLNKNEIERNSLKASANSKPPCNINNSREAFLQQQLEPKLTEVIDNKKEWSRPLSAIVTQKEESIGRVVKIKAMISRRKIEKSNSDIYVAKFAYVAQSEGALSFNRGDEITVTEEPPESSWWRGMVRGKEGLVPREYIRKKD